MAATVAALGGLDILVNNAGLEISSLVVDLDPADIRKMLEVNLLGTMLGVKHAFRAMRPGRAGRQRRRRRQRRVGGCDHRISRYCRLFGDQVRRRSTDQGGRQGVRGKLGYGVRVNCVYPGLVPTEMGQIGSRSVTRPWVWPHPRRRRPVT